jgi:hypothetical protein
MRSSWNTGAAFQKSCEVVAGAIWGVIYLPELYILKQGKRLYTTKHLYI